MAKTNSEINKRIITKIKNASCKHVVKDFLNDVFSFERDYLTDDLGRFSAQYKKYADYYVRKMKDSEK
jgi:hypothetical protein